MADQLASLFEDFKLEDVPNRHVLEIKYPVCGLLPPDTKALLRPPHNLKHREAPPHDQRRAKVFQSLCRIHIPVEPRDPTNDSFFPFPEDELVPQFTAFQNMARGTGTSHLEAVTFHDKDLAREFIRLELHLSLKREDRPRHYDFELSRKEWEMMVAEDESEWVKALDELVTRRTDLAYYHVRNRLAADEGEEFSVAEEAKWGAGWGGTKLRQEERDAATVDEIDQLFEGVGL